MQQNNYPPINQNPPNNQSQFYTIDSLRQQPPTQSQQSPGQSINTNIHQSQNPNANQQTISYDQS